MISYNQSFVSSIDAGDKIIKVFSSTENIDKNTVESFGEEWSAFHTFNEDEIHNAGDNYFDLLPKEILNKNTTALDVGCGTGRWSYYLSDKVGSIECIDPSKAVLAASKLLVSKENVRISQASADNIPFADNTFDLVFSLGVLHHIPDTAAAVKRCVEKVKHNGYILLYLYYNLENRGLLFKTLFHVSNSLRWVVSKLPSSIKKTICDILAVVIYMPFVWLARTLIAFHAPSKIIARIPLSWYADKTFNIIRNDSLDRFGTPLEQRFSKAEITQMLAQAGCTEIVFADNAPFWRVIAQKK